MSVKPSAMPGAVKRHSRRADKGKVLQQDVAALIQDTQRIIGVEADELAHDIIIVVRERVLREIESYARENIR